MSLIWSFYEECFKYSFEKKANISFKPEDTVMLLFSFVYLIIKKSPYLLPEMLILMYPILSTQIKIKLELIQSETTLSTHIKMKWELSQS